MLYLILVAIMMFVTISLSGFFAPPFPQRDPSNDIPSWYHCCDTGDGEACKPITEKTIQYNGQTYALLKSDTYPVVRDEQYDHFSRDGKVDGVGGIYINSANDHDNRDRSDECKMNNRNKTDWIRGGPDDPEEGACTTIPKKLLVYFCRYDKNNPKNICDKKEIKEPSAALDVYIKLSEANNIPDAVKNCNKPALPQKTDMKIVFRPSPDGQSNLQLRTFSFIEEVPRIRWLAPFCKPAIYLYPKRKTEVNVSVAPQGKMLLTIPQYPKNGWDVIAEPNGDIYSGQKRFDYLYYEASLPDQLIQKPSEGFVITYDERAAFLKDLVAKIGLNEKETQQFVEYWVPILPKSPYYFVGIIPQTKLHEISPLMISPKPDSTLRLTLYFQALEKKETVTPPVILPFNRQGFTAVEWGGIFKQDKNHPFSCFM